MSGSVGGARRHEDEVTPTPAAVPLIAWDSPVPLSTRTAEAYREIKRRIIEVELLPGASITEGELAAQLGVSKTPAREALARLGAEGLVEPLRNGYRVAPVTLKAAEELFELRLLLEPEATARAASRPLAPEVLQGLAEVAEIPWDREDPSSVDRVLRANTAFHVRLAQASGSEKLAEVLERILLELARVMRLAFRIAGIGERELHQHTELLALVAGGQAEAAREHIRDQIAWTRAHAMQALLSSDAIRSANVLPGPQAGGAWPPAIDPSCAT
jgi:DNA-binding GntR family transcriptional regulator